MKAAAIVDPARIPWDRYPDIALDPAARQWIETQIFLGFARSTIDIRASNLQDFLEFCKQNGTEPRTVTYAEIARYVGDLRQRTSLRACRLADEHDNRVGLALETISQRITSVRLFLDHLVEDGLRENDPIPRGRRALWKSFDGNSQRGILPRLAKLPWIPNDEQWRAFLAVAKHEPIRNRCMLALAYDAALRPGELCQLRTDDIDPAHRTLLIRAEISKIKRDRVVPYSAASGDLLKAYLDHRRSVSQSRGRLFLSESLANRGAPIANTTWTLVIRRLAQRAELPQFCPYTLRHMCLTDLARAGWDIAEIAQLAGHTRFETTLRYIHLSGRDLTEKLANRIAQVHGAQQLCPPEALLTTAALG